MNRYCVKRIKGFEEYAVGFDGTVYSYKTGLQIKAMDNGCGYLYVELYSGGKRRRCYIHRLVAEAWIDNPFGLPIVNHKDGNTHHNYIGNLEWISAEGNVGHAAKQLLKLDQYKNANEARKRKIKGVFTDNSGETAVFESIREAERRTGIPSSNIVANLKGRKSQAGGIVWRYVS